MNRPAKKPTTPTDLLRTWLISSLGLSLLFFGLAAYIGQQLSQSERNPSMETASLRVYREERLPELEATADRQELIEELHLLAARMERLISYASDDRAHFQDIMMKLPRIVAMFGGILLFFAFNGYGYLIIMRKLVADEKETPNTLDVTWPTN